MTQARKFRKKPVEIEAMLYDVHRVEDVIDWLMRSDPPAEVVSSGKGFAIVTLEGEMLMSPGDYIIRGVSGEFYPCKPDIFAATYEAVDEPRPAVDTSWIEMEPITANEIRKRKGGKPLD